MEEIWKDIKGYENLYQVSNLGRVKSLGRWVDYVSKNGKPFKRWQKETITYGSSDGDGYKRVTFRKNKKEDYWKVHRLVAIEFNLPIPDYLKWHDYEELDINHKDEDKANNNIDNLEWCTAEYNDNYGTRNNRMKNNLTNRKDISITTLQYTLDGQFVKEYPSASEAERQTGVSKEMIRKCCKGGYIDKRTDKWININQSGGYIWKYKKED